MDFVFAGLCPLHTQKDTSLLLPTANTAGDSGVAWVSSRYGASLECLECKKDQEEKGQRRGMADGYSYWLDPGRILVGILVGKPKRAISVPD